MSVICEIEFENNPPKVVSNGQMLRGNVHLTLTKSIEVKNISLKISGLAYSHWTEGFGEDKKSYTYMENCVEEQIIRLVFQQEDLTPGSYDYPFEFELPSRIPSSFEGKYGHIRYKCYVDIEDQKFEKEFTVLRSLDLSSTPALRKPIISKLHKKFYPCGFLRCFKSNELNITASIPFSGYVPGQTINVQIEVNNKSNKNVSKFEVKLIQCIIYKNVIFHSKKTDHHVLSEKITQGCDSASDASLCVQLVVPSILPSDGTACDSMEFYYAIMIEPSVSAFWYKKETLVLPFLVGSIPIVDNNAQTAESSNFDSDATIPTTTGVTSQETPLICLEYGKK